MLSSARVLSKSQTPLKPVELKVVAESQLEQNQNCNNVQPTPLRYFSPAKDNDEIPILMPPTDMPGPDAFSI